MLAVEIGWGWLTAIKVGAVMAAFPVGALLFVYVFLFKAVSHMQSRLGPMEAGPHGTLQPVVELVKFLQKEDIFPEKADRIVFALAPFVVGLSAFLLYAVIPAGPRLVAEDLESFLRAWGTYYGLLLGEPERVEELVAELDVPEELRSLDEDGSDEEFYAVLAWACPGLPDPRPDPYERGLTAEQVNEFARSGEHSDRR